MRGRGHVLLLAGIVLVALVARGVLLREPIRYDEAYTWLTYGFRPVGEIVEFYNLPNNHILNSVLMHESVSVFGDRLWSLRLPSWVAGVLLVPATYLAGRALYGPRAGLWAAALAAGSAPLIDFAVIARGFSPGLLFVVLALWAAAAALNGARRWPWAVIAVSGALAVWSVPTVAHGMAIVGLWAGLVLAGRRDWRTLAALVASAAAAGLIAYLLYRPTLGQPGWDVGKSVDRDLGAIWDLAKAVWANWQRALPWPAEILFAAAFAAGLVLHKRIGRQGLPVAVVAAVVLLLSLATGVGAGRFPRYWLAYLPFVLLTAGAGVAVATEALAGRRPRLEGALAPALAAVLAALVLVEGQRGAEEPPNGENTIAGYVVNELGAPEVAADPILFAPVVDYYLYRDRVHATFGHITPSMTINKRAVVAVPGADERTVLDTARKLGGQPTTARLLKRFDYMSVWEVGLAA